MAATITLDPWCIGDDETVAVYAGWAGFVSWVSTYYGLTIA